MPIERTKVIAALGLDQDVSDADIEQALDEAAATDPSEEVAEYTNRIRTLEGEINALTNRCATAELAPFANRMKGNEEFWKTSYANDPDGTIKALESTPEPGKTPTASAPLLNRADASQPANKTSDVPADEAAARKRAGDARAYMNRTGVSWEIAWNAVRDGMPAA